MILITHQQNFMKIATHDSATGEKGKDLLSIIGTPFARTQSKTIKEQYEAGCRMFDIRVKLIKGEWRCAHGLWQSKRLAYDILNEINSFEDKCYVTITYEGNSKNREEFVKFVCKIRKDFLNIKFGNIAIKYGKESHLFKVKYDYIYRTVNWPGSKSKFISLGGSTWHILIPIPWLWKKIYYNNPIFTDDYFTYVDFL